MHSPKMTKDSVSIDSDSLQSVLNQAHELMKKYANLKDYHDFQIEAKQGEYYDSGTYAHLFFERPETPVEQAKRLKQAMEWEKDRERYDRLQYEALKKKFGG